MDGWIGWMDGNLRVDTKGSCTCKDKCSSHEATPLKKPWLLKMTQVQVEAPQTNIFLDS